MPLENYAKALANYTVVITIFETKLMYKQIKASNWHYNFVFQKQKLFWINLGF